MQENRKKRREGEGGGGAYEVKGALETIIFTEIQKTNPE